MAYWNRQLFGPSKYSLEANEDSENWPVRINYFAVQTFTLSGMAHDVILFSASWFKFHPTKTVVVKLLQFGSVTFWVTMWTSHPYVVY